jgi:hypothetical protein
MKITDYLSSNSKLQDDDNPFKELINNTIGYFFELIDNDTDEMNNSVFIQEATGKYLDLHGKDLDYLRRNDESDEEYRNRIILDSLDRFTFPWVYALYDLQFLTHNSEYDKDTMLLSDNHYLNKKYFVVCTQDTFSSIRKKFITHAVLVRLDP